MTNSNLQKPKRLFVPQVTQPTPKDSAPTVIKALLEGFGISVSLIYLRDILQTNIQAPTFEAIQTVLMRYGIESVKETIPEDHLLLPETGLVPAIVSINTDKGERYLLIWNIINNRVQVMDPAHGRLFYATEQFRLTLRNDCSHDTAGNWRSWAEKKGNLSALKVRMGNMNIPPAESERLIQSALADEGWQSIAALDASIRQITPLVLKGVIKPGNPATSTLDNLFVSCRDHPIQDNSVVPKTFWNVLPAPPVPNNPNPILSVKGITTLRILGVINKKAAEGIKTPVKQESHADASKGKGEGSQGSASRGPRKVPRFQVEKEAFLAVKKAGIFTPIVFLGSLVTSAFLVALQALFLQGIMRVVLELPFLGERIFAVSMAVVIFLLISLIELPISVLVRRFGRQVEIHLRAIFLTKIPLLSEKYFRKQQVADLSRRAYGLRSSSRIPTQLSEILRDGIMILLTTAGIIWLVPASAPLAILSTATFIFLSWYTTPLFEEHDAHINVQNSSMIRYYLDSMIGLLALRSHGGERAMRLEHEAELVHWVEATKAKGILELILESLVKFLYGLFAVLILAIYLATSDQAQPVLLLIYWVLNIPRLTETFVNKLTKYPASRVSAIRALEPLGDPQDLDVQSERKERIEISGTQKEPTAKGIALDFQDVSVQIGNHRILKNVNLTINPGDHVAMIGPSGAGKSTLVGLLFGWQTISEGTILVDRKILTGTSFFDLRKQIAWVDPSIHIWNRTLLYNLYYGKSKKEGTPVVPAIEQAELFEVLEELPDGMQSILGEGGGLISGGEGQRIRLARSMLKDDARLVILDEPFRGLDRDKRHRLLHRARQYWKDTTLLCITHDVGETQGFDRVLVLDEGRIVEDSNPEALSQDPASRYHALLDSENALRKGLWAGVQWRRLFIQDGHLKEL